MTNEEIAEKIVEDINREVMDFGDYDWIEILETIIDNLEGQVNAKKEEQENKK